MEKKQHKWTDHIVRILVFYVIFSDLYRATGIPEHRLAVKWNKKYGGNDGKQIHPETWRNLRDRG